MAKKKEKEKETPALDSNNKDQQLEIAKKAVMKKYGNVIGTLSDKQSFIPTISSGSIGLDLALGRGGFARGRIYELYGPTSSGKTTLAMSVMAQAQKRGLVTCFCDAEHTADPKLFEAMGVSIEDVIRVEAYVGEDNLDSLETLIKTGAIDVAVVDSVSALIPGSESEAEIGDDFMGLLARLMSKATRRFAPLVSRTGTLLIFINQLRNKIGTWGGDPRIPTGGEALGFYSTGRISVSGGEFKNSRILDTTTKEPIGHITKFEVVKNKLAPPFRTAEIPLIYGKGYDLNKEVLDLSVNLAIIDLSGAYYYYKGEKFAHGEAAALAYMVENRDFHDTIRNSIIELTGLKEFYELNS